MSECLFKKKWFQLNETLCAALRLFFMWEPNVSEPSPEVLFVFDYHYLLHNHFTQFEVINVSDFDFETNEHQSFEK